ncbi:MAG: acetolactate synthase small subunit [Alphaproteobacteria bacterium GM7ARS4]|nr:acetolactate synthase small subunit [Alphaproteobacteria bacterium GM7ARS4]
MAEASSSKMAVLSVLVDNEAGVLARVIGLFSGRGYNIESLTVSEVDAKRHLSRITISTIGSERVINQITNQLERLVPVHKVFHMTPTPHLSDATIARDAVLVKVFAQKDTMDDVLTIARTYSADLIAQTHALCVYLFVSTPDKVECFIKDLRLVARLDICRSGIFALDNHSEDYVTRQLTAHTTDDVRAFSS